MSVVARARLALRERGVAGVAGRVLSAPIRATALGDRLFPEPMGEEHEVAAEWFAEEGRPATVVARARAARQAVKRTTRSLPVTVVDTLEAALATGEDIALVDDDVLVHGGWLEMLQNAAYKVDARALVGARQLDRDAHVVANGLGRPPGGPFVPRYAGRHAQEPVAEADVPVLAEPSGCVYVRRDAIDALGGFDGDTVAFCQRAWDAGLQVIDHPPASVTRLGPLPPWREAWDDDKPVRTAEGKLRIAYVTEDCGVGGGHRVIFEHLNRLAARGHEAILLSLDEGPDWFDLQVPIRSFERYEHLVEALDELEAIKVATWWNTALATWLAGTRRGRLAYFVQDIETSYYPVASFHGRVLSSYREEFRTLTTSGWVAGELRGMGLEPEVVGLGIDLETFRPLPEIHRRDDLLVTLGRGNPLKRFDLTAAAYRVLREQGVPGAEGAPWPELRLFGSEPQYGFMHGLPYVLNPSDAAVNRLYNEATVLVLTSAHEGFSLPPLEAMAAGCPVVCTDADGNRDFAVDGENCLMPEPTPEAVAAAVRRVLEDTALRERLTANGLETAARYGWEPRIDTLEAAYERLASPR